MIRRHTAWKFGRSWHILTLSDPACRPQRARFNTSKNLLRTISPTTCFACSHLGNAGWSFLNCNGPYFARRPRFLHHFLPLSYSRQQYHDGLSRSFHQPPPIRHNASVGVRSPPRVSPCLLLGITASSSIFGEFYIEFCFHIDDPYVNSIFVTARPLSFFSLRLVPDVCARFRTHYIQPCLAIYLCDFLSILFFRGTSPKKGSNDRSTLSGN